MHYQERIKQHLARAMMRDAVALRTQRFGSGRIAFRKGQPLVLVVGLNGMQYVYEQGTTAANVAHGTGLLYTYSSEEKARKYVV